MEQVIYWDAKNKCPATRDMTPEEQSQKTLDAKQEVTRKEELKQIEYIYLRKSEYPDIGDQLDAIMKWAFTETEIGLPEELKSLAGQCMAVKSKYPKPE